MGPKVTLLELVDVVNGFTASEAETVAAVARLVNQRRVVLCGTFRGQTFDLDELGAIASAA